jgi:hypothetical protein
VLILRSFRIFKFLNQYPGKQVLAKTLRNVVRPVMVPIAGVVMVMVMLGSALYILQPSDKKGKPGDEMKDMCARTTAPYPP